MKIIEIQPITFEFISRLQCFIVINVSADIFKNIFLLANQLQFIINNFEFHIKIHIVSIVFAVRLPLSKLLQTIEFYLCHSINIPDSSINVLKQMRKNLEK